MRAVEVVERDMERRVEDLGFELVELRWGGSKRRPVLQLRIDKPDAEPGTGVTVDECAQVSRALEPWLDGLDELSERYVLEVSSPGVDRPLTRPRDFERFRGKQVALRGHEALLGKSTRLEGELLGLEETDGGDQVVRMKLPSGDEVAVPRDEIRKAHLVFTWK